MTDCNLRARLAQVFQDMPEVMSEKDLVRGLNEIIPSETWRVWRHANRGPRFLKLGRKIAYLKSDVIDFLCSTAMQEVQEAA